MDGRQKSLMLTTETALESRLESLLSGQTCRQDWTSPSLYPVKDADCGWLCLAASGVVVFRVLDSQRLVDRVLSAYRVRTEEALCHYIRAIVRQCLSETLRQERTFVDLDRARVARIRERLADGVEAQLSGLGVGLESVTLDELGVFQEAQVALRLKALMSQGREGGLKEHSLTKPLGREPQMFLQMDVGSPEKVASPEGARPMGSASAPPLSALALDPSLARVAKLKECYDLGVLSRAEFEAKLAEIT